MSFGIGIGDVLKLCEIAGRVYKNCRDCTGEYKSLTSEARQLSNLLEDIQDKLGKIPESKLKQFQDAYEPCVDVLQELDKVLAHYNSLDTKTKRTWDRLKWDPEKYKMMRTRLMTSVAMLNVFYTSILHDSQVLILEALGRLEQDYRGGHREESIPSLERITATTEQNDGQDDEAAWSQILRDLEDVGVATQDALSYRDMIIGWLVTAVDEGRLLEQHTEQGSFSLMPQQLSAALPVSEVGALRNHHLDVPDLQKSQSVPCGSSSTLLSTSLQDNTANSIPPATTLSVPENTSIYAASFSSDTDTSSSCLEPQQLHTKEAKPMCNANTNRVPVPTIKVTSPTTRASYDTMALESMSVAPIAVSIPTMQTAPLIAVDVPTQATPSAPEVFHETIQDPRTQLPFSYFEKESLQPVDLAWNSQQIMAAWTRRDFYAAERHLEDQVAAVERGVTVATTGAQPDRRVLRHLLGVAASFTGNFQRAKGYFESVFNGIYLHRANLDDGDIAAARWLGDVCLHLREHDNAVLAWAVAFEGSLGRYGIARDRTQRISEELRLLEHWLFAIRRIEHSFLNNFDPTDIFRQTHAVEKSNLISTVKTELYGMDGYSYGGGRVPQSSYIMPIVHLNHRPMAETMLSEGFLLSPLISYSAWPMSWDATFSPLDCAQLNRLMHSDRLLQVTTPLVERSLSTSVLRASKEFHFVTRRGSQWLIETVKKGLREMCIEHAENPSADTIVCCLSQHRDGYALSEGVEICFKKLQFRNAYGFKITQVKWSTRRIRPLIRDVKDFREVLKSILERVEKEEAGNVSKGTSHELPDATICEVG